eukprot:GFUD01013936.1.p1 GENE.GFUD01013936.1~~GFUD01013936.1.p1  ORF type:complete len:481 (+),score=133.82 GFUD01013936.1:112-1554(+)
MDRDRDHFSCDEEDCDTFSSVSQAGGQVLYDSYYTSWNEEQEQHCPPVVQSSAGSLSPCSKASEDMETSSQVARSIISGLFHRISGQVEVPAEISVIEAKSNVVSSNLNESRSTRLDFEGSDCSNVEYQIGEHLDQLEASDTNHDIFDAMFATSGFEANIEPTNLCQMSPVPTTKEEHVHAISLKSSSGSLKEQVRPSTNASVGSKSDGQEQMQELARSSSSFTARINDWINTVSIKERDLQEETKSVSFQESVNCSTPLEHVTMEDGSDVYSDDDDQPAGYTSPARALENITESTMDMVAQDSNLSLDEIRNNFQKEARTNISSSLVPTTAFKSFDQGFSNVQVSNGKELFDNGLIRQRQTGNYIRSIPTHSTPRNYHFKITETTEQTMKLNKDGSQVVDTTHKREQSENSYDQEDEKKWYSFLKLFLVLVCLLLVLAGVLVLLLQYLELVQIKGLQCFMEENGLPARFDASKKTYIEV